MSKRSHKSTKGAVAHSIKKKAKESSVKKSMALIEHEVPSPISFTLSDTYNKAGLITSLQKHLQDGEPLQTPLFSFLKEYRRTLSTEESFLPSFSDVVDWDDLTGLMQKKNQADTTIQRAKDAIEAAKVKKAKTLEERLSNPPPEETLQIISTNSQIIEENTVIIAQLKVTIDKYKEKLVPEKVLKNAIQTRDKANAEVKRLQEKLIAVQNDQLRPQGKKEKQLKVLKQHIKAQTSTVETSHGVVLKWVKAKTELTDLCLKYHEYIDQRSTLNEAFKLTSDNALFLLNQLNDLIYVYDILEREKYGLTLLTQTTDMVENSIFGVLGDKYSKVVSRIRKDIEHLTQDLQIVHDFFYGDGQGISIAQVIHDLGHQEVLLQQNIRDTEQEFLQLGQKVYEYHYRDEEGIIREMPYLPQFDDKEGVKKAMDESITRSSTIRLAPTILEIITDYLDPTEEPRTINFKQKRASLFIEKLILYKNQLIKVKELQKYFDTLETSLRSNSLVTVEPKRLLLKSPEKVFIKPINTDSTASISVLQKQLEDNLVEQSLIKEKITSLQDSFQNSVQNQIDDIEKTLEDRKTEFVRGIAKWEDKESNFIRAAKELEEKLGESIFFETIPIEGPGSRSAIIKEDEEEQLITSEIEENITLIQQMLGDPAQIIRVINGSLPQFPLALVEIVGDYLNIGSPLKKYNICKKLLERENISLETKAIVKFLITELQKKLIQDYETRIVQLSKELSQIVTKEEERKKALADLQASPEVSLQSAEETEVLKASLKSKFLSQKRELEKDLYKLYQPAIRLLKELNLSHQESKTLLYKEIDDELGQIQQEVRYQKGMTKRTKSQEVFHKGCREVYENWRGKLTVQAKMQLHEKEQGKLQKSLELLKEKHKEITYKLYHAKWEEDMRELRSQVTELSELEQEINKFIVLEQRLNISDILAASPIPGLNLQQISASLKLLSKYKTGKFGKSLTTAEDVLKYFKFTGSDSGVNTVIQDIKKSFAELKVLEREFYQSQKQYLDVIERLFLGKVNLKDDLDAVNLLFKLVEEVDSASMINLLRFLKPFNDLETLVEPESGRTLLQQFAVCGKLSVENLVFFIQTNTEYLNAKNKFGNTILHILADLLKEHTPKVFGKDILSTKYGQYIQIIKELIQSGANPSVKNNLNQSFFTYLFANVDSDKIAPLFTELFSDQDLLPYVSLEDRNEFGQDITHLFAFYMPKIFLYCAETQGARDYEIILKNLLTLVSTSCQEGTKIDWSQDNNGNTMWHIIAETFPGFVKSLEEVSFSELEEGSSTIQINLGMMNNKNETILHKILQHGSAPEFFTESCSLLTSLSLEALFDKKSGKSIMDIILESGIGAKEMTHLLIFGLTHEQHNQGEKNLSIEKRYGLGTLDSYIEDSLELVNQLLPLFSNEHLILLRHLVSLYEKQLDSTGLLHILSPDELLEASGILDYPAEESSVALAGVDHDASQEVFEH